MTVWQEYRFDQSSSNDNAQSSPAADKANIPTFCWLPGWGFDAQIFLPLIKALNQAQHCRHFMMQWPEQALDRATFIQQLYQQAPAGAVWIGWSLGGVLASLAAEQDTKIERVVTLATGVTFLQALAAATTTSKENTLKTGMAVEDYQIFKTGIQSTNEALQKKTARRFISLCCQNVADPRGLQRQLQSYQLPDKQIMANTLAWLEDYRLADHSVVPQVHCYGGKDALQVYPHDQGLRLPETGHLFWLAESAQEVILQQIQARDKQLVAQQFSRAAATYDQAATIQQQANHQLLQFGQDAGVTYHGHWLDIGCGTGAAIEPLMAQGINKISGFDLAPGMIELSRQRYSANNQVEFACADADRLPTKDHSIQGIWSSLMLQWSEHPQLTLKEWFRTLAPSGTLLCATLLPGTHHELKQAWQAIDQQVHVNQFTPNDELLLALANAGFVDIQQQQITLVEHYSTLPLLLRGLKAIGATNVNPGRRQGLGGKAALKALAKSYPSNQDGQLPLTYELCLLSAKRPV